MRRYIALAIIISAISTSCSDIGFDELCSDVSNEVRTEAPTHISRHQAELIAELFRPHLDGGLSRSEAYTTPESIDCVVEGNDTILYVLNYSEDNGYMIIGTDDTAFPIIGHSAKGNLKIDDIADGHPLHFIIDRYKAYIKKDTHDPAEEQATRWSDIGKPGYKYEIKVITTDPDPGIMKARREYSTGKASVYPYSGINLDCWAQTGGYNVCAPNQAKIGCPALTIGMLLYDTFIRATGNHTRTNPYFGSPDSSDLTNISSITQTAEKLKQVADKIPNYNWGKTKDAESGASFADILSGLKVIGYKQAEIIDYDFELLYSNLSYKENNTSYSRGVIIGAANSKLTSSHIWFCDGYKEQSYKITKTVLGITKSWTEYEDCLYMNWGYGANGGNGWYTASDNIWKSDDNKGDKDLKTQPKMYINLQYYEYPK